MFERSVTRQGVPWRIGMIAMFTLAAAILCRDTCAQGRFGRADSGRPISLPAIGSGFLFVEGHYIAPPYEIELGPQSITINGEEFGEDDFNLSHYERDRFDSGRRPESGMMRMRRGKRRFSPQRRYREEYRAAALDLLTSELSDLRIGSVIVLYRDEQPMLLSPTGEGHQLLQILSSQSTGSASEQAVPVSFRADSERESWQRLIAEFEPNDEFLARAGSVVARQEQVIAKNTEDIEANLLRAKIGFPLTMFAIVVVVLAFGHLLSNAPLSGRFDADPESLAHGRRAIVHSLVFVGLLSAVDLIWTLIAYQAGSMRELNPLGRGLIESPSQLIAFKFTVTAAAIGLLYWLHQAPIAQRASWWCCLILTLLTARWLTFQSMFL